MRISAMHILGRTFLVGFCILSFLMGSVLAQAPEKKNPTSKSSLPQGEDPDLLRWRIYLDSLPQESKTVFPEERRPYAIVEVANAYWDVDTGTARQLFIAALDSALSLSKQDKKYRPLIDYVLSAATRRDFALAKELTKRLVDAKDANSRDNISSKTALDLLNEDPVAAARLAEEFAPQGLRDGTAAFLLFSLAKKDFNLSDRLFSVYLGKVIFDQTIPLESVLVLGGYSFGYSEYYSVYSDGQLGGASFPPIANLRAKPTLTFAFLDMAFSRIGTAIERRNQAVGVEVEAMNYPILFAVEYLTPEVAKFFPNRLPAWQHLKQQALATTSVRQIQQIESIIQQINQARLRARQFSDQSQNPEDHAEASLENVEKIPGTCQRDVIYTRAALVFASRKKFERAIEIARKVEDLKQSGSVKEIISINMADAAIQNGEFEDAKMHVEKVGSLEHKAMLYVRLAQALIAKNENRESEGAVTAATKIVEKLPNGKDRAGIYFALSAILLKTDPAEAEKSLGGGIKNLNKLEASDQMDFSVPIKVPFSCPGEPVSWYGGSRTLPNSNILDAITVFAKTNPDGARQSAEDLSDKITKIRASAIVVKIALANVRARSKNQVAGN